MTILALYMDKKASTIFLLQTPHNIGFLIQILKLLSDKFKVP